MNILGFTLACACDDAVVSVIEDGTSSLQYRTFEKIQLTVCLPEQFLTHSNPTKDLSCIPVRALKMHARLFREMKLNKNQTSFTTMRLLKAC